MRLFVALISTLALVMATSFPWHWCVSTDGHGTASVVFAGSHAHEGHCDHDGCGHDEPGDTCCVDVPSDPCSVPAPGVTAAVAPDLGTVPLEAGAAAVREAVFVAWRAPVPRAPTETVVLLR